MALISSSLGLTGKDAVTFLSRYRCVDPLADEALSAPRPAHIFCGKSLFLLIMSIADGCFWVHLTTGSQQTGDCCSIVERQHALPRALSFSLLERGMYGRKGNPEGT